MQFMKSGLDKIVKNLSDSDFKYLIEGFGSVNLATTDKTKISKQATTN